MNENYMRDDFKTKPEQRLVSDGVHPTISCGRMEAQLKAIGFRFVGGTVILSFQQHVGMMNHHGRDCFVFPELERQQMEFRHEQALFWDSKEGRHRAQALDSLVQEISERVSSETKALAKAKRQAKLQPSQSQESKKRKLQASSSSGEEAEEESKEAPEPISPLPPATRGQRRKAAELAETGDQVDQPVQAPKRSRRLARK